jgi:tetratricopeptide (TPR) repeat protein
MLLSVLPSFNHQAVANPLQESEPPEIVVLSVKGQVTLYRSTESVGRGAAHEPLMYGDRLVTGASSEATLQFADRTVGRVDELTELWIQPSGGNWGGSTNWEGSPYVIEIPRGGFYLLNREQALNQSIWTPAASAEILGTEVVFRVNGDGTTHAVMYEGQVRISNEWGEVVLGPMEESTATLGRAPSRLPLLEMVAPIQWTYYYPAVLDLDELALPEESLAVLAESLKAYRTGDLNVAVLKLPEGWNSPDEGDRVYRAALAMAAGQVEKVEQLLQGNASLTAEALRRLISAVQGQAGGVQSANGSASLALAESYVAQSSLDLPGALEFARSATALNPHFAFAQARVAELEFGMGRVDPAREALDKARRISPRHAPSLALEGFMAMSQHRYLEARSWMDAALEIDGDYGDAWLGRGLLRVRHGDVVGGRQDLQVAVALQPTRSVTRSYLAKGYALEGDVARAENEIQRARELDFFDATSWLYGAMLKQQQSRFNEAIEDLELSKNLNERRAVFRSTHLLDQDLAMRGANLAAVYKDGGLLEWSAREAARGISYDYADGASHQFLATSFDNLRDVQGYNPRYQAPWINQ